MIIVNFSHPLSTGHLEEIVQVCGQTISEMKNVRCQVDDMASFSNEARRLVDAVNWSPCQWQQHKFLVVLPGLANIAAAVLAEIHGRCGYFPTIIRLRSVRGTIPPQFDFAELVKLDAIRARARSRQ